MREKGFNIRQIGLDKKFGREFHLEAKRAGFNVVDTPQLHYLKSEGFRRIEAKVKQRKFYYLHNEAYLYCVKNVRAIEQVDDAVKYEKVMPTQRIDLFDASVFACMEKLQSIEKTSKAQRWLRGGIV